jgi:hypothetical protein
MLGCIIWAAVDDGGSFSMFRIMEKRKADTDTHTHIHIHTW